VSWGADAGPGLHRGCLKGLGEGSGLPCAVLGVGDCVLALCWFSIWDLCLLPPLGSSDPLS